MTVHRHFDPTRAETHQMCAVRGEHQNINHCLKMLRRRFPVNRFPELDLRPILAPPMPVQLTEGELQPVEIMQLVPVSN